MRQTIKRQQYLHPVCLIEILAQTSTINPHQRRSGEVPGLRAPFFRALQGCSAAVEQVPTAAAFSSVCDGVRVTGRQPATLGGPREDTSRDDDGGRTRMRGNRVSRRFPRRTRQTTFSDRFSVCPASQGKAAVVGPVPAAAAFGVSTDRHSRADIVGAVAGGRAQ